MQPMYPTIIHQFFVCLFPIQICTVVRNTSKCSAPTDEALVRVHWDWQATTCPMREDCQSFFTYPGVRDAILIPHIARLFTAFDCLKMLQTQDMFLGERLAMACPVVEDCYICIWDLEAILLYVI